MQNHRTRRRAREQYDVTDTHFAALCTMSVNEQVPPNGRACLRYH